ncbi:MAG: hypothetical protein LBQ99_00940 [Endomicrobium sp.]|nr:hypothetical protein [Endomicrobium sp.]
MSFFVKRVFIGIYYFTFSCDKKDVCYGRDVKNTMEKDLLLVDSSIVAILKLARWS